MPQEGGESAMHDASEKPTAPQRDEVRRWVHSWQQRRYRSPPVEGGPDNHAHFCPSSWGLDRVPPPPEEYFNL